VLTESQRAQVEELIFDFIGIAPSPLTLRQLVGPEPLRQAPASANGAKLAGWMLSYSLRLPQPTLFIRIITVVDAAGQLVEVHQLVDQLQADASLWQTQVLDELWVPPTWPFIDRESLRQTLAAIADGTGPGAITIEAPAGHGKRTMSAYIEHLARRVETFQPVVAELRRTPDPGVLDSLVADLRLALGLDLESDTTHQDPERQAVVLARRLALEAQLAPTPVWLVANVVEVSGLEEGVLRFLDELLGQVQQTPAESRQLSVVLLSDEVARLGLANLPDVSARFVLPEVNEAAVSQWLEAAVPGKSPQLYTTATALVLQKLEDRQPPPAMRLRWLARHCVAAHRQLVRAG
jgi:hypothetical protein